MDKKTLVIETARELFQKYGYKKVTMDEIAKTSGVTKKTIYTYFKDKDSLFEYFVHEELENMKKEIESNKKNKSLMEVIILSVSKMLRFRNNSELINSIFIDSKDEIKIKKFINMYDKEIRDYIELQINSEIDKKTIKKCDAHLTAFIIYKIFLSVLVDYDGDIDEKKVIKEITSILEDGLLN